MNGFALPQTVDIDDRVHYNKITRRFSAELSEFPIAITQTIILRNPKTGTEVRFFLDHKDTDGSGEDIYGWHYNSEEGYKLLIVND